MAAHQYPPPGHVNDWWSGAIRCRAERWAEAVYARTKGRVPWPGLGGIVAVHARRAIIDVISLSELGERQVQAAYDDAREHYERLSGP